MRCERLEVLLPDQKPPEVRDKFLEGEGSCTVNNVTRSPGARLSWEQEPSWEQGARSRLHCRGGGQEGAAGNRTSELSWREGQNSGVRSRAWEGTESMEYKSITCCQLELGAHGKMADAHTVSKHSW